MTFNTWEELHKHFGLNDGTRDRFDLTAEEEREFVNGCYELYEKEGFSNVFYQDGYAKPDFHGGRFEVIGRCTEETHDLECLPMWKIRFLKDGFEWEGYSEEICLSEILENNTTSEIKSLDKTSFPIYNKKVTRSQIKQAEQCLIDNGIDEDDVCVVLQALGYILLDAEFYPEDC